MNECEALVEYRGAGKSLARPVRKQAIVSVREAWISFDALPCRKKKNWWQLASRCCWNRALSWNISELVFFLAVLRTYQHPGNTDGTKLKHSNKTRSSAIWVAINLKVYFFLSAFLIFSSFLSFFHLSSFRQILPFIVQFSVIFQSVFLQTFFFK